MLLCHFTNEQSARNIIENGIKLPFHLTTNLELGSTYGAYIAAFKVEGDLSDFGRISRVGFNGNGTTNKYAQGMMELIIETPKQLNNFLDAIEAKGLRHVCHFATLIEQQRKERIEKENKPVKPKKRSRTKLRM